MYRKFFPGKNIQTVMFWRKKLPIDGFQDRKRKKKKKWMFSFNVSFPSNFLGKQTKFGGKEDRKEKKSTSRRIFLAGEDKEKSEKSSLTSSSSFRFIFKDK